MDRAETKSRLKDNLAAVEARIQNACRRAGRERDSVWLIAVTKYVTSEIAALLPELGIRHLGESRPQELWRKAADLPKDVYWHLIGHLQRNKIERTIPIVAMIHSVDSHRLLAALSEEAEKQRHWVDVLLEVNLSREANKYGFAPNDVPIWNLRDKDSKWPYPSVYPLGLMTMAAASNSPEQSRPVFAELRRLRETIQASGGDSIRELSMGMSHDFEVAIEEGATMVRIGSALFEGLLESKHEPP